MGRVLSMFHVGDLNVEELDGFWSEEMVGSFDQYLRDSGLEGFDIKKAFKGGSPIAPELLFNFIAWSEGYEKVKLSDFGVINLYESTSSELTKVWWPLLYDYIEDVLDKRSGVTSDYGVSLSISDAVPLVEYFLLLGFEIHQLNLDNEGTDVKEGISEYCSHIRVWMDQKASSFLMAKHLLWIENSWREQHPAEIYEYEAVMVRWASTIMHVCWDIISDIKELKGQLVIIDG